MAAKRLNGRLIKLHHTYSVEQISLTLCVHKNTVRGWRQRGLTPIDDRRPVLFRGQTLREFLERERRAAKRPSPPGHLYCLRCRASRLPALGMVDCVVTSLASGNLKAICEVCETIMHRRVSLAALPSTMPGIEVHIAQAQPRLSECGDAPSNCDQDGTR